MRRWAELAQWDDDVRNGHQVCAWRGYTDSSTTYDFVPYRVAESCLPIQRNEVALGFRANETTDRDKSVDERNQRMHS